MDFTALFVEVDDFWSAFGQDYERRLLADGQCHRRRRGQLCLSEIMTILIAFQTSHFRDFKHFYAYLGLHHRQDFPGLVSYSRFVSWIPRATMPLFAYLINACLGPVSGISFIDSTALKVCGNKRISRHRVFRGLAALGKTMASESGKVLGAVGSLSAKQPAYDRLQLEKGLADRQLAAGLTALETARSEASRKQLYLERLVQPNQPDSATEPRRFRSVVMVFLLGLVTWATVSLVLASVREHVD